MTPPAFCRWFFNFIAKGSRPFTVILHRCYPVSLVEIVCVAVKLKHHRLKPGGVEPSVAGISSVAVKFEAPPAEAGGVNTISLVPGSPIRQSSKVFGAQFRLDL